MRKKLLSVLLTLVLCLSFLPIPARAADTEYDLWVAGVRVKDSNKDAIATAVTAANVDDNTAAGTITFDSATNTLTAWSTQGGGTAGESYGIKCAVLTLESGTVTSNGGTVKGVGGTA